MENFLTNQTESCVMNHITQQTVKFITDRIQHKNFSSVDLTWFNKYSTQSLSDLQGDFVLLFDVADPIYFEKEKVSFVKKLKDLGLPCILIGSINNFMPCPTVPFYPWLRYRQITGSSDKIARDNFFISFNRFPHNHRKFLVENIKNAKLNKKGHTSSFFDDVSHPILDESLHKKDIVKYQNMCQQIDELQLHSLFEIVSETYANDNQINYTEKIVKCISTATPLLLLGNQYALYNLKKYYGFTDFGIDDSYDKVPDYHQRVALLLKQAHSFFDYPLDIVFDNAKKNAHHLNFNFDSIHDDIASSFLEKSLKFLEV